MKNQKILTPYFLDQQIPGLEPLAETDWILNRPELGVGDLQTRISRYHRPLSDIVANSLEGGARPVSLAGDCCTSIAMLAGIQKAGLEPRLLWLDAHGDFNTWETTPSGFLGGMPLAMLVGRGEQTMNQAVGLRPLSEDRVWVVDARDLDPGERTALEGSRIVHRDRLSQLDLSELAGTSVWVHFDSDILNPEDAPAMNYLATGGPDIQELKRFFQELSNQIKLIAVSVSTWNPEMEGADRSRTNVMGALDSLLAGADG